MDEFSETIIIRISEEEKKQAVHDAHRHDMNLSQYLRFLIRLGSVLKTKKEEKK